MICMAVYADHTVTSAYTALRTLQYYVVVQAFGLYDVNLCIVYSSTHQPHTHVYA
jgi:hypothetical protein